MQLLFYVTHMFAVFRLRYYMTSPLSLATMSCLFKKEKYSRSPTRWASASELMFQDRHLAIDTINKMLYIQKNWGLLDFWKKCRHLLSYNVLNWSKVAVKTVVPRFPQSIVEATWLFIINVSWAANQHIRIDFWRIMWHWSLQKWCWKFSFAITIVKYI